MNLFHLKRTDNAERIRISTPLKLETLEGCRFVMVGDADPNPGADLFVANYGYEDWIPGRVFRKNSTQFLLRYVLDGEGTYCGRSISKGYCYLSVPGVEYEITSSVEYPLRHFWVAFEGEDAMRLVRDVFGRVVPFVEPFANCERAIEVINDVLCGNFGVVNEHYYHISSFYRLLAFHSALPKPPANIHHHDFAMYLKAMDYIDNEYNQKLTVNEIANRIHIVPSYLYRIFIKYSGVSPQQALMRKRMQMAAILLDQRRYTIGQVAEMVGYSDALQFSKFFKKHFAMSPSQYSQKTE